VSFCRCCNTEFSVIVRKHHCRCCGGIYCDNCAPVGTGRISSAATKESNDAFYLGKYAGRKRPDGGSKSESPVAKSPSSNVVVAPVASPSSPSSGWFPGKFIGRKDPRVESRPSSEQISEENRCCIGCRLGEAPGPRVRAIMKEEYVRIRTSEGPPAPIRSSEPIIVKHGSLYGDGHKLMQKTDGTDAHSSGYLEILNKGDFVCCIKIFVSGGNVFRECCKPAYVAGLMQYISIYII
jgi:hypothetical protein